LIDTKRSFCFPPLLAVPDVPIHGIALKADWPLIGREAARPLPPHKPTIAATFRDPDTSRRIRRDIAPNLVGCVALVAIGRALMLRAASAGGDGITREDEPIFYWACVFAGAVAAAFLFYLGLRR
jgi:hypothetical protein